ncbi:serine/threonine protein kinase [Undibacterium sp. RuRC25W]|uniref:serine/threonine protein kinase n=1 Tax=Undibacterium sp. RuRC25W TaxID=3413047 RepID=UPI003BEFDB1A
MQNNSQQAPAQATVTPLNKRVGRFYLIEKLGVGSTGTVFRGHDPVIDRDVAIKILNTVPNASDKKQREQQFINEARAAGRLSHPSIVTIFDASSEGGTTFIAMEFLPGHDLRQLLANGKTFDIIEIATIIKKIADALTIAHTNGVIHRDIKPGNIFILPNNHPKVVDFGIARAPNRLIDENQPADVTLFKNNILGTPNYMSPEQATGKPVNALTDVYSLGAVMYEMLTLQKPFYGNDIDKLLHQIANKSPKWPSEVNSVVPASLSKIVMKAMQKDLSLRYQSTEEMSQALYRFLARSEKLKKKGRNAAQEASGSDNKQPNGINSLLLLSAIAVIVAIAAIAFSKLTH